jgi:hypothetical protein
MYVNRVICVRRFCISTRHMFLNVIVANLFVLSQITRWKLAIEFTP